MLFIYSFLISIYSFFIRLASLTNAKAQDFIKGRKGQLQQIEKSLLPWQSNKKIWLHAASYGEYEMALPIINAIKKQHPQLKWVISFYSPSGYTQHHINDDSTLKIYLPFDLKHNQNKLTSVINPIAVIFIKYEFWFNLLSVLRDKKIPYYFTSLHLNAKSYLLKPYTGFLRKLIKGSKKIYAHNPTSVDILENNGFNNVTLFGDSRVDQVLENRKKGITINWSDSNKKVIAFGSIGKEDFAMVQDFIRLNNDFNIIVATHDVDKKSIELLCREISEPVSYYSIDNSFPKHRLLCIDTMGDLKYLYNSAHISYIGGGFKKGPHNVLEPLVFGNIVITGSNVHKFPMALYLANSGMLHILEDRGQFQKIVRNKAKVYSEEEKSRISSLLESKTCNLELLLTEIKVLAGD